MVLPSSRSTTLSTTSSLNFLQKRTSPFSLSPEPPSSSGCSSPRQCFPCRVSMPHKCFYYYLVGHLFTLMYDLLNYKEKILSGLKCVFVLKEPSTFLFSWSMKDSHHQGTRKRKEQSFLSPFIPSSNQVALLGALRYLSGNQFGGEGCSLARKQGGGNEKQTPRALGKRNWECRGSGTRERRWLMKCWWKSFSTWRRAGVRAWCAPGESSVGCAPSTKPRSHLAPVFILLQVPEYLLCPVSGSFGKEMDACVKMPGRGFPCKKGPSRGPSCGAWLLFGLCSWKLSPVLAQLGYFGHFKLIPI